MFVVIKQSVWFYKNIDLVDIVICT